MENKKLVAMAATKVLSTADRNMPHNSKFINADIQSSRVQQRQPTTIIMQQKQKIIIKQNFTQKLAKRQSGLKRIENREKIMSPGSGKRVAHVK